MTNLPNLIENTAEIRKVLATNPDLPIVTLSSNHYDFDFDSVYYCSDVEVRVGEVLDYKLPFETERDIFTDRDDLLDAIVDNLYDEGTCEDGILAKEYNEIVEMAEQEMKKYDAYWRPAIILYMEY